MPHSSENWPRSTATPRDIDNIRAYNNYWRHARYAPRVCTSVLCIVFAIVQQEMRDGVLLTVGSYGERCQCDNSTSGTSTCLVGREIKEVCSGR